MRLAAIAKPFTRGGIGTGCGRGKVFSQIQIATGQSMGLSCSQPQIAPQYAGVAACDGNGLG
jgi:hypothetical protein